MSLLPLLLYGAVLGWGYVEVIHPVFAYEGYVLQPNPYKIVGAVVLLLASGLMMSSDLSKPSGFFVQLWCLTAYVPLLVLFALADANTRYILAVSLCSGLILLLQRKSLPRMRIRRAKGGPVLLYGVLAIISAIVHGVLISRLGFRLNFSFTNIYSFRDDYVHGLKNLPFMGYLTTWQGYVINPTLFGIGLRRKRPVMLVGATALQVILFSITGFRNLLSAFVFILAIIYLLKRPIKVRTLMSLGVGAVVGVSSIANLLFDDVWMSSLAVRRLLMLPARIQLAYFDFFSQYPKVMLSHSVLSWLFPYPYDLGPTGLIARFMDPTENSGANTGFLADAYMNFGFVGMLVFSFLLVVLLRVADGLAADRSIVAVLMPLAMPFFALTNSALLTTMLTHGILFGLLVAFLQPNELMRPKPSNSVSQSRHTPSIVRQEIALLDRGGIKT